jgi:hypothetical protein
MMNVKPGRPKANAAFPAGVVVIAVLVLLAIALSRVAGAIGATPDYPVNYRVASHNLTAAEVATTITARLTEMGGAASSASVTGMTVVPMSELAALEPEAGAPVDGSPDAAATVWVVRAEGAFVGLRVPPGAKPIHSATGYFIVDDATGEIIGMGMP